MVFENGKPRLPDAAIDFKLNGRPVEGVRRAAGMRARNVLLPGVKADLRRLYLPPTVSDGFFPLHEQMDESNEIVMTFVCFTCVIQARAVGVIL